MIVVLLYANLEGNPDSQTQNTQKSIIKPLLEQLPLLLNQQQFLGLLLYTIIDLIGPRPRHLKPRRNRECLLPEPIPIILHEHIIRPLLLPTHNLLLILLVLLHQNLRDDILEMFVVHEWGLGWLGFVWASGWGAGGGFVE